MGKTKIVKLDKETEVAIRKIIKEDTRYRVRKRATAILYKSQGYRVDEIAKIVEVRADTVYGWIRNYEAEGIASLYDKKGRGRKSILKDSDADMIKEVVLHSPSIPAANAKLKERFNIFVHDNTLKNYIKKTQFKL